MTEVGTLGRVGREALGRQGACGQGGVSLGAVGVRSDAVHLTS